MGDHPLALFLVRLFATIVLCPFAHLHWRQSTLLPWMPLPEQQAGAANNEWVRELMRLALHHQPDTGDAQVNSEDEEGHNRDEGESEK